MDPLQRMAVVPVSSIPTAKRQRPTVNTNNKKKKLNEIEIKNINTSYATQYH